MLSQDEIVRYQRQLLIPDFGLEGQSKLKEAHALIVGVGGLGCSSSLFLTAAASDISLSLILILLSCLI